MRPGTTRRLHVGIHVPDEHGSLPRGRQAVQDKQSAIGAGLGSGDVIVGHDDVKEAGDAHSVQGDRRAAPALPRNERDLSSPSPQLLENILDNDGGRVADIAVEQLPLGPIE